MEKGAPKIRHSICGRLHGLDMPRSFLLLDKAFEGPLVSLGKAVVLLAEFDEFMALLDKHFSGLFTGRTECSLHGCMKLSSANGQTSYSKMRIYKQLMSPQEP